MRIRSVMIGLAMLASACGGHGRANTTARSSDDSIGRETTRADRSTSSDALPSDDEFASADDEASVEASVEASGEEGAAPAIERADGHPMLAQETNSCPADLAELEVVATAIPSGGAMVFTVADEGDEALRGRLRLFAKVHELHRLQMAAAEHPVEKPRAAEGEMAHAAPVPEGSASTGRLQPKLEENPPEQRFADDSALVHRASEVAVVETDEGVRLEIRIDDRRRIGALRAELREHATMLSAGNCPLALSIAG